MLMLLSKLMIHLCLNLKSLENKILLVMEILEKEYFLYNHCKPCTLNWDFSRIYLASMYLCYETSLEDSMLLALPSLSPHHIATSFVITGC